MSTHDDGPAPEGAQPIGAAATRLTDDIAELVRQEMRRLREDAVATARRAGAGAGLLAGAGVCATLSLAAGHHMLLRALETTMPRTRAAAVLALAYAVSGGGLAACALLRLRETQAMSGAVLEHARRDLPGGRG